MTATCTFNSTTVESYEVRHLEIIGSTTVYSLEATLACRATSLTNYNALAGKRGRLGVKPLYSGKVRCQTIGGTKGDLVLNGTTYTNCYISDLSRAEVSKSHLGVWEYTISFVKETA